MARAESGSEMADLRARRARVSITESAASEEMTWNWRRMISKRCILVWA